MRPEAVRRFAAAWCAAMALGGGPASAGDCEGIPAGADVQARLDAARPGSELCLAAGRHAGPLRIGQQLVLRGPSEAVVVSSGSGSTIMVEADGVVLEGFTVDGSGGRFDLLDAAVRVHADGVRVEGLEIRGALFGLLVEQSRRVVVRGCEVRGDPEQTLGMRGDGIRLWEVRESRIEDNRVLHSRDVVVWYSPGNRITNNRVEDGRYGTHFMYSHGNEVIGNVYLRNVVGIFAMYSRDLDIRRNLIARSSGAAGVGLGAKESGGLRVEGNWFVANTVGTYLDTSPLEPEDHNRFQDNVFRFSDAAVIFHGVAERNGFHANSFVDNGVVVRVEGRGDARAATWQGNHYDDYAGYDLDGDGVGDLPYEVRSLSSTLESRRPSLAFFRGGVAMALVELAGEALPLLRPKTLMVDPAPRMRASDPDLPAREESGRG